MAIYHNSVKVERIKALSSRNRCEYPKCGDQAEFRIDVRNKDNNRYAYAFSCGKHKADYEETARGMKLTEDV